MADIAEAAEVSKGTPYLYFPSKEALFIALHEEWDCGLAARIDAAVGDLPKSSHPSPRAVLAAVASAIAAHVLDNPQTCRVLMEATTLAAYEPAIAAKVQASNAGSRAISADLGALLRCWPAIRWAHNGVICARPPGCLLGASLAPGATWGRDP